MSAVNGAALASSSGLADDPVGDPLSRPSHDGVRHVGPTGALAAVCLLVEGTYPFVSGGVSSWVHDVIRGHPDLTFAVLFVGSYPGAHGEPRYELPANVVGLHRVFCQESALAP